jgi:hypothetical protein
MSVRLICSTIDQWAGLSAKVGSDSVVRISAAREYVLDVILMALESKRIPGGIRRSRALRIDDVGGRSGLE